MAEVKIDVVAEDRTAGTLNAVVEGVRSALGKVKEFGMDASNSLKSLSGLSITIDASDALRALGEVRAQVEGMETEKRFSLDVSSAALAMAGINAAADTLEGTRSIHLDAAQAMAEAIRVKAAIDAIPDIAYKTVIVRYQTMASPLMPFAEGIRHIRSMMESLPTEGTYTVRFGGAPARTEGLSATGQRGFETRQNISFAPTINIHSSGGEGRALASEIDRELARMWRYNRSELRRAMDA
jgi:hypothetical protein